MPGGYLIPLAAAGVSLWLMSHAPVRSWLGAAAFVALGALVYVLARRRAVSVPR